MHTATTILFFSSISTTQFYCIFSPTTTAGIPLSSLFLYHTATVTLLSLLLLHHHIYDFVVVLFSPPIRNGYVVLPSLKATRLLYCRVILLYHTAAAAFSSLIYDHHNFIVVLSPRPHFHGNVAFYSPSLPAQFPSSSFLSNRTDPTTLSTLLQTTTSATFVVMLSSLARHRHHPHNCLGVLAPHQEANVFFSPLPPQFYPRSFLFTNLPQLLVCYLPSSTTSTTTLLSPFPLYHTSTVILSILLHRTVTVLLSCLLHLDHDQKTPETYLLSVNPVTVLAKVLVYFVFSFTLIHLKMWYSCGHNGRDRLWKNQPYSVHVWLTIRTQRTQEHVAHEGKKPLTIVNLIYSFL